jgi:hypothetical protein
MSTRNISWGGAKAAGAYGWTYHLHVCTDCLEIWEPKSPGTLRACRRTALPFYHAHNTKQRNELFKPRREHWPLKICVRSCREKQNTHSWPVHFFLNISVSEVNKNCYALPTSSKFCTFSTIDGPPNKSEYYRSLLVSSAISRTSRIN